MNPLYYLGIGFIVLLVGVIYLAIFQSRTFVRGFMRPTLTCLYRAKVVGLENLPRSGGIVIVSNHVSWIDGVLLLWLLPRNIRFVVEAGNFESRIINYLGGAFDTIMMKTGPKAIGRALHTAREALNHGECVGIFAEGTLTRTGHLQAFRPGSQRSSKALMRRLCQCICMVYGAASSATQAASCFGKSLRGRAV